MADFEINLTAKGAKEVNLQIEKMTAGLSKIIKEVSDLGIKLGVASTSTGDFAEAAGTTSEATEDLVESSEKLRTAVSEVAVSVDKASESYQEITKSVEGAKLEFTEISDSADDLTGSLTKVSNSSENAGESLGSIGDNADEVAEGMVLIAEQSIAAFEIISEVAASAIEAFSTFNQAMISTSAIGEFTRDEMGKLTEKVIELGIATSATPLDIADLTTELARAGYAANEQIGALEGIIRASEASGESLSDTGAIIGQVIKTFGLSASESITVADSLVAAANSTSASIVSLGEGFTYVGSQAVLTNQSVNEIVTGLALLSDVGLAGSVGGTALAEALRRLSLASAGTNTEFNNLIRGQEKMSGAFSALGASIRDSNGQLLPLSQILPIIKQQLDKLESQEDKEIIANALFGVQGGRGFLALMEKVGGSFEKVNAAIVNSEGVAKQTGEVMLNSLGGSFKLLNSSIDTLNIEIGAFAGEVLRPLIEAATGVINGFLNLPPVVQKTVFSIGALTTAVVGAVLVMSAYEALQIKATVQAIASAAAKLKETAANFLLGKSLDTVAASALNSSRALLSLDVGFAKAARSGTAASASIAGAGVAAAGSAGALATLGTAIKSFTTLIGAGLIALAPFVAAAAAWGLVVKTWGSIREPAKNAQGAIDELNVALEGYNTLTGQSVQLTEQTKGVFGELKDAVRGATNDIEIFLFNFKLLPGVSSANESALRGLAIKLGDMQASLNGVASEFNNYRIANKLSTEEAQALIPVLEAAKAATSVLQQEAAKLSDNKDQLVALQAQQKELSGMIDQLKAAAPAQEEFGKKSLDAASAAADAANKIKEAYAAIGSNLESNLRELDLQITQALTDANNDILLNAEERETAITNIESQGLTDRLKLLEQSLQQRQAISGIDKETQQENAEEIKALEEEIATTKLEIAQESAAAREEAEAEFLERQKERIETEKALRQAAYDEEVRQIEDLKNQAELAAQARIDAQNAVLESLDDQSTAIANQTSLLELQLSNQQILSDAKIARLDEEINALGNASTLIEAINSKELGREQLLIAQNELRRLGLTAQSSEAEILEAIKQKTIEKQGIEAKAFQAKQLGEKALLELSQAQQRIELQRSLTQARIAEIEAQSLVTQAKINAKAEKRLLNYNKLQLAAAIAEGASQSELIALQGQVQASEDSLALAESQIPLAQQGVELAGQQVRDAENAVVAGEKLFDAQGKNLDLAQKAALEAFNAAQNTERLGTALGDTTIGANSTADGLERAATASGDIADNLERTGRALNENLDKQRALNKAIQESRDNQEIERLKDEKKRLSAEQGVLEFGKSGKTGTRSVTGEPTQYFIEGKQVSLEEFDAYKKQQAAAGKSTRTLGGVPLAPSDDSYSSLKFTIQGLENFQKNTESMLKQVRGLSPYKIEEFLGEGRVGKQLKSLKQQLGAFFTNYKDQSLVLTDELLTEEIARIEKSRDEARKKLMADNSQRTQDEVEEFTRKLDILDQIQRDRLAEQQRIANQAARAQAEKEADIRQEVIQIEGDKLTADQIKAERDLLEFRIANEESLKGWELDRVNARLEALKQVEATLTRISELERLQSAVASAGGINIPGRAAGGPVFAGRPYIVGERRPELFVPRVPGTIVPRVPQMSVGGGDLSKVEALLTQLVNRPLPTVNAPATFINQPNPLQTQIELLQGQLRAARGAF